jgi:demethylmenaquinone methyltransferase / 2-methoxy-6-polyprenyl-1,4-benzoquinol methylase
MQPPSTAYRISEGRISVKISTVPTEQLKPEHERTTGARPEGATTEQSAAQNVQQMFDDIAPTYDRANHILSVGLDRWMWSRAARTFRPILQQPEATALDLCCGTGDMTLALYKHRPKLPTTNHQLPTTNPILAVDFSHQMLTRGAEKFRNKNILPIEADALHLPIASASIDLLTSAFGFRNLANYEEGLAEILRILRPGGQLGILECNQPEGLIGAAYNLYFKGILPKIGGLISKQPAAYNYLPASVERFPRPPRMLQLLRNAGFANATWTSYALGTAGLYRATKP